MRYINTNKSICLLEMYFWLFESMVHRTCSNRESQVLCVYMIVKLQLWGFVFVAKLLVIQVCLCGRAPALQCHFHQSSMIMQLLCQRLSFCGDGATISHNWRRCRQVNTQLRTQVQDWGIAWFWHHCYWQLRRYYYCNLKAPHTVQCN